MAVGDLITQAEYQTATGSGSDPRVPGAIEGASSAIRAYTGRLIGLPIETETRSFDYDGSGVVEIDDVVNVTDVSVGSASLQAADYVLRPRSAAETSFPYYWVEVAPAQGMSPEMGFTFNLDQFPFVARTTPLTVDVTGDFGWPDVPEFAKQAAIWTVDNWLTDPTGSTGGQLSSEAIADFSQAWSVPQVPAAVLSALPERAREVLDPIVREAL